METLSAGEIAARVRAGGSPREAVDACLARIEADNHRIGAFQLVDADGARRAADALRARPDLADLPLAGVPVAVKDNMDVAGLPTRHGSAATSAAPAEADDELVRRLRAAGAIIVGKTKLPELAIWGFTESIAHGGTRNPRQPTLNAGGSTGGGAAAVAAGMAALALGSDGGGSLRIPAAHCGVVGFKPARGVLPLPGGFSDHWYGCSVSGPIAATVADAALAMDVLAGGSGWRDSTVDSSLRVAYSLLSPSPIGRPLRPYRRSVQLAVALAGSAGHRARRARLTYPLSLTAAWTSRWHAGIAEEVERLGLAVDLLERRTRAMVNSGARLRRKGPPGPGPAEAWRRRALALFAEFDVLITPVVARPAPRFGWGERTSYRRAYLNGARGTPFTQAWNLAGFPALSLPLGGSASAPGSVQLISAPGREAALLRLAADLERLSARKV